MNITLDQARALDHVVTLGTVQRAAEALNKGHSAVLYLLKNLEAQTGLTLFDRSGYRNQITTEGEMVLRYCRQLIAIESELDLACKQLHEGWESSIQLVYDGVIDFSLIGRAIYSLHEFQAPTEIKVSAAYLDDVHRIFEQDRADIMVTILPIQDPELITISLPPINMLLVCHSNHRLGKLRKATYQDVNQHTYIKIQGTMTQLGMSTESLELNSSFLVNDFHSKKTALLNELGYGWMPEYMIRDELRGKELKRLRAEFETSHRLNPSVYFRRDSTRGRLVSTLLEQFQKIL